MTSSVPCNDSKDFNPFYLCRETVGLAFKRGLVVEPSGAAALAAFLTGKVNFKIYINNKVQSSLELSKTKITFTY